MAENFKKTLFGYSKKEVCEYLLFLKEDMGRRHQLEVEELTQKLAEMKEQMEKTAKQLEEAETQIQSLQEQVVQAEKKAEDETDKVSAVILDARRFADELKADATAKNEKEQKENSERNAIVEKKILACSAGVDKVRAQMQEILEQTAKELAALDEELNHVGEEDTAISFEKWRQNNA